MPMHLTPRTPPASPLAADAKVKSPQWVPLIPRDSDMAAGPLAHMSLALEEGMLPWFCCQIPGICTFSMIAVLCYTAAFSATMFACLVAALAFYIEGWTLNMSIFSVV